MGCHQQTNKHGDLTGFNQQKHGDLMVIYAVNGDRR
jgi:hypothetical protein